MYSLHEWECVLSCTYSLRRKQSKYPVMFLTACLNPIYDDPLDVRAHTMHDAMMHVTAEKLSVRIRYAHFLQSGLLGT